jgi:glyoxylase-like metal-dependent hydrolase (beta-lactamase superfamily II)
MRRVLSIVFLAGIACGAVRAIEIQEVAPGVHFRLGDRARGQSNGGFIVCDDYVVAIEAPSAEASNEMLAEVKNLTDRPIRFLVITHGHWDHDGGLEVFTQSGVTVIVHDKLQQLIANAALWCSGL